MNKHKHYDAIIAFAYGAQIEGRPTPNSAWNTLSNPSWENSWEYRIKPEENKPWKPKDGESYYFVDTDAECVETRFDTDWRNDKFRVKSGNCFRTLEEAEAAAERVKAALKGGDVSKKDAEIKALKEELESLQTRCENLHKAKEALIATHAAIDGVTLTDGEIALIKAFRNGRLCRQFSTSSSLIVEGHDKVPCGVTTHREFVAFFMGSPMQHSEVRKALNKIKKEQEANND